MNVLWGAPNIGVDTHVFRNAHRYGWVGAGDNTPEKVEAALLKKIPKKYHGNCKSRNGFAWAIYMQGTAPIVRELPRT